jgi:hypothetical protein
MPTAQEVYASTVRTLPPEERLRLAALILDGLVGSNSPANESGEWSEQDRTDVTEYALRHAQTSYPEEEELI